MIKLLDNPMFNYLIRTFNHLITGSSGYLFDHYIIGPLGREISLKLL